MLAPVTADPPREPPPAKTGWSRLVAAGCRQEESEAKILDLSTVDEGGRGIDRI